MTSRIAPVGRLDLAGASPLGPLLAAFVRRDPALISLLPRRYDDLAGFLARARARLGTALPPDLAAALLAHHRRLDAPARSLAALSQLAEGRAVCVVAGQQPGPLGGPLYTWHKAHTAAALARALTAHGVPAVPLFWNASEDDDFEEIAHATWAGPSLAPAHGQLAREAARAGRLVGALPAGLAAPIWHAARGAWAPLAGGARALSLLDRAARAAERGGDLGDVMSELLLATFGDEGLVVLDPRLSAFRAAARPLYERYAELHRDVRDRVDRAGDDLEALGLARGFSTLQTEFALFAAEGAGRRHLRPSEAAAGTARGADLIPGALLRPIAQDFVLPAAALVAGPGEIAYLAQLPGAYEVLGVEASTVVPRWTATWLPRAAVDVCEEAGVAPEALIENPDRALAGFFAGGVPPELTQGLLALRAHVRAALGDLGDRARGLDRSLPQQVEATGSRVDFRFARLGEGFTKKARRSWKRAHPEGAHLATYLRPGGRLQERSLAWLDVVARGGGPVEESARERAAAHVEEALAGRALYHDCVAIEDARG